MKYFWREIKNLIHYQIRVSFTFNDKKHLYVLYMIVHTSSLSLNWCPFDFYDRLITNLKYWNQNNSFIVLKWLQYDQASHFRSSHGAFNSVVLSIAIDCLISVSFFPSDLRYLCLRVHTLRITSCFHTAKLSKIITWLAYRGAITVATSREAAQYIKHEVKVDDPVVGLKAWDGIQQKIWAKINSSKRFQVQQHQDLH